MEKTQLKNIIRLGFFISLIYTCKLMLSNADTTMDRILILGTALVLEFGKCIFLVFAFVLKELKSSAKTVMVFIGSILFLISICASLSSLFNQANATYNKSILNSDSYLRKKTELTDLKEERSGLPHDWIKTKEKLRVKISELDNELDNNYKLRPTTGYVAFFEIINGWITKKNAGKPMTTERLTLMFFAIISIVFEALLVFLFYIDQVLNPKKIEVSTPSVSTETLNYTNPVKPVLAPANTEKNTELKQEELRPVSTDKNTEVLTPVAVSETPKTDQEEPKRKIGFHEYKEQEKKQAFTNEELKKYKEIMFKYAKENNTNVCLGVRSICEQAGIEPSIGFKIKNHLDVIGVVKSEKQKTYIIKDIEEIA